MKDTLKKIGKSAGIVGGFTVFLAAAILFVMMIVAGMYNMYLYSSALAMVVVSVFSVSALKVYQNYDAIVKKLDL